MRSAIWKCDRWGSPLFEAENYEEEKTCDNKRRNNNNNNNNNNSIVCRHTFRQTNTAVLLDTI